MVKVEHSQEAPAAWESLWDSDLRATLFLHPRWLKLLQRLDPRLQPHYLIASEGGEIVGLLPFMQRRKLGLDQFLSMPLGTHGGPLLRPGADASIVAALCEMFRRLVVDPRTYRFEMQILDPASTWRAAIAPVLGQYLYETSTHIIRLTEDFDEIWSTRYNPATRNCVRQAEYAGVTVACESGRAAVATLHQLQLQLSHVRRGIRVQPLPVLETICEMFGEEARIFVARRDGRPLSATLFLEHPPREVHAWLNGAGPEAREVRATHLLYHEALRDACARRLQLWHFGASAGKRSIEFFKESFGAVPAPLLRYRHLARWAKQLRGGDSP